MYQDPPRLENQWRDDRTLRSLLGRVLPQGVLREIEPSLDRMGALAGAYAQSEVGIVCGTFAPIGGHDLSEPLQLGAASLYGPHVERQRALDLALKGMQGAVQVVSAAELPAAVLDLLDRPAERDAMVARYRALSDAAGLRLREVATDLVALAQ